MFKKFLIGGAFLLASASFAFSQGIRIGDSMPVSSVLTTPGVVSTVPNSLIAICTYPANAVPCTNKATTYTSATLVTPCSTSTQIVLAGTTSCVATTDNKGNWGAWVAAGNYDFTIQITGGQSFGPFTVTAGATGIATLSNITSSSANPATAGFMRLACTDYIMWRNSTNTANNQLQGCSAANGNLPADIMIYANFTGNAIASGAFIVNTVNTAVTGDLRMPTGDIGPCWRNNANSADVCFSKNTSDQLVWSNGGVFGGSFTFTGNNTFKTLNAIQFADQYSTTAPVAAPINAPGLYFATSGGTVGANSYKCEVTFIGATSGETTASPASASVTTTGAVSILYCNQNEVPPPAGALTYNVYWQTAGAGSYFQGHTSIALGVNDAQTSTPPISGSTPPGANTAIGILPSVQVAIGGAGTEVIPSTVSSTLGAAGSPTAGQTIFDWRTGQIFSQPTAGKGHYIIGPGLFNNTQEDFLRVSINKFNAQTELNLLFNPVFNGIEGVSSGLIVPNSSTTGQANGLAGYVIDQRSNPVTPAVGVFGVGNAQALNARAWGGNFVGTDQGSASATTNLYGQESDCFVGIVGTLCTANLAEAFWLAGIQPTISIAYRVGQPQGSVANARWSMGYRCDTNATFSTDGNNACLFMFPVATGISQNSQGIEFVSTRSDGASPGGSLFLLPPGDLQLTSTAGGHGFTLGSTGMPLNFTEGTAPGTAALSVDVCYGDSTAHAVLCSYNNGSFFKVPLVGIANTWTAAQTLGAGGSLNAANLLISPIAPTIAGAGCGGSAASIPNNNGTAAFTVNVGTAPTAGGCTITLPAATTGWACFATDITTNSVNVFLQKQTSGTTTSAVIQNFSDVAAATAFTASDILRVSCHGY